MSSYLYSYEDVLYYRKYGLFCSFLPPLRYKTSVHSSSCYWFFQPTYCFLGFPSLVILVVAPCPLSRVVYSLLASSVWMMDYFSRSIIHLFKCYTQSMNTMFYLKPPIRQSLYYRYLISTTNITERRYSWYMSDAIT